VSGTALQCGRRALLVTVMATALARCGSSPITADRIEHAIKPTFANLVHVQISRLGLSPVAVSDLQVSASCYRPGGRKSGAGDWICMLIWSGPNGPSLHDRYDVSVTTDGCYTASVDASESQLGGPTIRTQDGRAIRNVLYAFDGCFDAR
jgi:hypothetical protein